jgi:gentisate 1,2-dioxygenase
MIYFQDTGSKFPHVNSASYMLMKGSGRTNFDHLKDQLYPFSLEDLESLPQYSSLNIINYQDGKAKFITKLPPPIK